MHIVIFAGGTVQAGDAVNEAIKRADMIIAADGGAATALRAYARQPAIIVGDLDSLDATILTELRAQGSQVIQVQAEKDETDTELAIDTAIQHGATEITLLGALGGMRFDHSIANVLLLSAYPDLRLRIVDGTSICWLLYGPDHVQIAGHPGDLLSLFPFNGDVQEITTTGLYYPLHASTLRQGKPRGISNVFLTNQAEISFQTGTLLCVQTHIAEEHQQKTEK